MTTTSPMAIPTSASCLEDDSVTHTLVYATLFCFAVVVLYAYLVWFGRRTNGWPPARRRGPGSLVGPLVAAARAFVKPPSLPIGARRFDAHRFAYLAAPIVSAVSELAALLLLPLHASGLLVPDWDVSLPLLVGLGGVSLGGTALGGWASGQEAVRRSAYAVAVKGWLFLLAAALALCGPTALAASWMVRDLVAAQTIGIAAPIIVHHPFASLHPFPPRCR